MTHTDKIRVMFNARRYADFYELAARLADLGHHGDAAEALSIAKGHR